MKSVAFRRGHDAPLHRASLCAAIGCCRRLFERAAERPAAGAARRACRHGPPHRVHRSAERCRRLRAPLRAAPRGDRHIEAAVGHCRARAQLAANALACERLTRASSRTRSLDRAIEAARAALIASSSAARLLAVRARGGLHDPGRIHHDDAFPGRDRSRRCEAKIAVYLRAHQAEHGGWPLYHGGELDISCTVKAYFALKLAGDSPDAPHMVRARAGDPRARRRGALPTCSHASRSPCSARFRGAACPTSPSRSCCCRDGSPFHLDKVSYWSRTVMVPLFILCTRKPLAPETRATCTSANCS